nr:Ig domain-containing protein [Deltaproteobacteria bacterium]
AEVLRCNPEGTAWESEPCAEGDICVDGVCGSAVLSVTTEFLAPATIGFEYAAPLRATGGTTPYVWSIVDGEVPEGLSLSADGTLGGRPEEPGDYVLRTRVGDAVGDTAERSFSLTVHSEPLTIITLPDLGTLDEGVEVNVPLLALGGEPPYGWFVVDGSLPEGLLVDAAGAITGTPLAPGPFDFQVRVVDDQKPPGYDEQDFSLQVDLRPLTVVGEPQYDLLVLQIIVLPLLAIVPGVEVPYSAQLMADGGLAPYSWSEQPLPAGFDVLIPQSGVPDGLVLELDGTLSGAVSSTDQVITVPLLGAGIDLTGFFFYAEVSDSQRPPEDAGAIFVIPTVPIGG